VIARSTDSRIELRPRFPEVLDGLRRGASSPPGWVVCPITHMNGQVSWDTRIIAPSSCMRTNGATRLSSMGGKIAASDLQPVQAGAGNKNLIGLMDRRRRRTFPARPLVRQALWSGAKWGRALTRNILDCYRSGLVGICTIDSRKRKANPVYAADRAINIEWGRASGQAEQGCPSALKMIEAEWPRSSAKGVGLGRAVRYFSTVAAPIGHTLRSVGNMKSPVNISSPDKQSLTAKRGAMGFGKPSARAGVSELYPPAGYGGWKKLEP